jgi:hypothetical protein
MQARAEGRLEICSGGRETSSLGRVGCDGGLVLCLNLMLANSAGSLHCFAAMGFGEYEHQVVEELSRYLMLKLWSVACWGLFVCVKVINHSLNSLSD